MVTVRHAKNDNFGLNHQLLGLAREGREGGQAMDAHARVRGAGPRALH